VVIGKTQESQDNFGHEKWMCLVIWSWHTK